MIKKIFRIYYILFLCLILTGCWDSLDVNEKSIVHSVGLDRHEGEVEYHDELTKIATNSNNNGEQSQSGQTFRVSSSGKNFELSRVNIEAKDPNPSYLGATRIVLFHTDFAEDGIEPYLNRIDGLPDYRKTLIPLISRESPVELFSIEATHSISVGFLIEGILHDLKERGKVVYYDVGDLLAIVSQKTAGYLMPYFGIERGEVTLLGYAVMKESKYVGVIDLENAKGTLLLLAKKPVIGELINTGKYENNPISFKLYLKKRKFNFEYEQDKLRINVELKLNADLIYQYFFENIDEDQIKQLEILLSNNIKKEVEKSIKDSQYKYECDYYNFAKFFRAKNYTMYEQINWEDEFINADVNVVVNTKITRTNFVDTEAKKEY